MYEIIFLLNVIVVVILAIIGPFYSDNDFARVKVILFYFINVRCGSRGKHTSVVSSQIFDVLDFYGEPVYLCTCVNVYKYVRIISYGLLCLSFTVCKRMLIFLGKVL